MCIRHSTTSCAKNSQHTPMDIRSKEKERLFFWLDGKKEKLCIIFAFYLELLVWLLVWRKTVCSIEWERKMISAVYILYRKNFCTSVANEGKSDSKLKFKHTVFRDTQQQQQYTQQRYSHTRYRKCLFQKRKKTVMNISPTMGNSEWIAGIWRT